MIQSKIGLLAAERGIKNPEELSKRMKLTRSTLYNVWSGDLAKRQLGTILEIAEVLNVPITHLFEVTE